MNTGTVKFYNGQTGFIQPTDGGKDVFVHVSALERPGLAEGQKLQFQLERDTKGRESAANLQLI
jgi:CspA family cold shock protein